MLDVPCLFILNREIIVIQQRERRIKTMLDRISLILVIIGALNWGSIGLFKFDIVSWICGGQGSVIARIIYNSKLFFSQITRHGQEKLGMV